MSKNKVNKDYLEKVAAFIVEQFDVSDLEQIVYNHIFEDLCKESDSEIEETLEMYRRVYGTIPVDTSLENN